MGVIEVEIKTLRGDRPIIFSWDNPVKKVIQCVLVTCPCQSFAFPETTNLPHNPDGTVMCDKKMAFDLAAAMDKADLITHSSLDNMGSLLNRLKTAKYEELEAKEKKVRARNERRKKLREERKQKLEMEKRAAEENLGSQEVNYSVGITNVQNRLGHPLEETRNDTPDSLSVEDQSFSSLNRSTLPGEQHIPTDHVEVVTIGDSYEPSSSDSLNDTGCSESTETADVFMKGVDVRNVEQVSPADTGEEPAASKKLPSDSLKDTGCGETTEPETSDVFVKLVDVNNVEEVSPALTGEEPKNLSSDSFKAPERVTAETGTMDNLGESVALKNVEVIPSTAATASPSVTEDDGDAEGLMEAIKSIFTEYSDAKEVLPHETSTFNGDSGNQLPVEKGREKVQFIRHLTEEERLKMFRFGSDTERENRKKLEQAKAYLCDICGKIITLHTRKKHMRTHEDKPERTHVCSICGKAFSLQERLKRHMETHDANRKFTCRYCPRSFRAFTGRTNHERRHFAVYPEECKVCDKRFIDAKSYKRHLHRVHGFEIYKEKTRKPSGVRQSNKKDKPKTAAQTVPCQVCSKPISKTNLRVHMYKHEGRMYTCNICGKVMAFSTRYTHRKLHSKQSEACLVCGKRVVNMNVHMRIHTGEKPYQCRFCDKRFSAQGSRQAHEGVHTNERPYKCSICDKSWKDRNCYRNHMQKLHPGEPIYYKRRSAQINISQRGTLAINPVPSGGTAGD